MVLVPWSGSSKCGAVRFVQTAITKGDVQDILIGYGCMQILLYKCDVPGPDMYVQSLIEVCHWSQIA